MAGDSCRMVGAGRWRVGAGWQMADEGRGTVAAGCRGPAEGTSGVLSPGTSQHRPCPSREQPPWHRGRDGANQDSTGTRSRSSTCPGTLNTHPHHPMSPQPCPNIPQTPSKHTGPQRGQGGQGAGHEGRRVARGAGTGGDEGHEDQARGGQPGTGGGSSWGGTAPHEGTETPPHPWG